MKRFFLIALAAGLFSFINANAADTLEFSIRRKTNPFTDKRVCWGSTRRPHYILRRNGKLEVPLPPLLSYRYRIDNDPPSEKIYFKDLDNWYQYYETNYPEEVDKVGPLIDISNLPKGEKIRYEWNRKEKPYTVVDEFDIANIKSTLAELQDCPIPKSY